MSDKERCRFLVASLLDPQRPFMPFAAIHFVELLTSTYVAEPFQLRKLGFGLVLNSRGSRDSLVASSSRS